MSNERDPEIGTFRTLEKLAKWRAVFAGWQLGTRTTEDPESNAVRDHREVSMMLRAEVSALTNLLTAKGVFTHAEWLEALRVAAEELDDAYERRFPGIRTTAVGIEMDARAVETMRGWRP